MFSTTLAVWLPAAGPDPPEFVVDGAIALLRKSWRDDGAEGESVHLVCRELERLRTLLNTPELLDFSKAVQLEAAHQQERWGSDHDAGKAPADWFWLLGYLAGKALAADARGDKKKALHHTISSAAVLANWHAALLGKTNMRPGIEPPKEL